MKSVTFRYVPEEDRLLLVLDAGLEQASSYWLTRRMSLNLIQAANPYLERMSPSYGKTPAELRGDVATMDREVALAVTEQNVSQTPTSVVEKDVDDAELAAEVTITPAGDNFGLRLRTRWGREAQGVWTRELLQRLVHTLEQEVLRAGWVLAAPQPAPAQEKPKLRMN